jgi:hypothetical protein
MASAAEKCEFASSCTSKMFHVKQLFHVEHFGIGSNAEFRSKVSGWDERGRRRPEHAADQPNVCHSERSEESLFVSQKIRRDSSLRSE